MPGERDAALDAIATRAEAAFAREAGAPPPLTLRGGSAVDGDDVPEPYDAARDAPTDAYLERFAGWAMPYLDATSWKHYLPHLMRYAAARPEDPGMVVGATVRSLRPPDREPPRLAALAPEQEAVVVAFLEQLALRGAEPGSPGEEAARALEEWWLPGGSLRPRPDAREAARAAPVAWRAAVLRRSMLELPDSLVAWGEREILTESRRVASWRGHLCGDAVALVVVQVRPLAAATFRDTVEGLVRWMGAPRVPAHAVRVPGARRAERLEGIVHPVSPAEPERAVAIAAEDAEERHTLVVRAWPRDDVARAVERIVASWRLGGA
ncbi:MAG TPA: DUF6714 family protein [Gemmatirosa sp.]|nr:DUF6714 family protein [Gemmatirosa sp.]